jgi:ATP-dependent DNA helicase DinG
VSLGASPIDVADILRERLFQRGGAVVMTSATLSLTGARPKDGGEADASFAFLRARLGIDSPPAELVLPSPFDYPAQAALYVPAHFPDPREPGYLDEAEREIAALVALTDGGAFVLCTSHRMMRALAERLRPAMKRLVLVQGEAPNPTLLEHFRQDGSAVLFATASFWQGVDVPGHALRLVIIDKLPFDVPTDPLIAARCERLREQGEEPFMKYLVPAAALALKQGFGRLIRSRRDRGIVAILDSRLLRKGYGKVLLRTLPPATRCGTLREVGDFWRRVAPGVVLAGDHGP